MAVNNHGGYGRWGFVEVSDMATFQKEMDLTIADHCADHCADGVTTGGVDL